MKNHLFSFVIFFGLISISFSQETNPHSIYEEFARFVSGKEIPALVREKLNDTTFWVNYQKKIIEDWQNLDSTRLKVIVEWRETEIAPYITENLPVFYPFSGPDFLHCWSFFPNSDNYIFLAQEMLGKIPDFSKMNQKSISEYLDKFYYSIRDIYMRSYFITARMNTDLHNEKISGVLPVLLFFMSMTNHEIIDVKYEYVDSRAEIRPLAKISGKFSASECVTIKFKEYNSNITKTLRYFRCDLSNDGLNAAPGFKKYLENIGDRNTYVKSASYLLHYETFSAIRNIFLKYSKSILQDDTGIPFKYFTADKWEVRIYGKYVKPIADFPNPGLFQKDLDKYYHESENLKSLPFSIGYHWRSGDQNQLFIIRK